MSIEAAPQQRHSESESVEQRSNRELDDAETTGRRWWLKLTLFGLSAMGVIGVVAAFASGVPIFPARTPTGTVGPIVTHTVANGDLLVTVLEQGTLESADNAEIKCLVRGTNTVTWVIESGTKVEEGDELLRLDTLLLEETITERTKYAHQTRSGAERAKANVARAELAIKEYEEGRYPAQLMLLEKDLAIAESMLLNVQNALDHAKKVFARGYISELEVEEKEFAVTRSKLDVELKQTQIDVLKEYTRAEQLETLKGDLASFRSYYLAESERAYADALRRDRAIEELEYCSIKAKRSGIVIYPTGEAWENVPEMEEGATVHHDQTLLLMPDLTKMQVKVGVHESVIDRVKPGLSAKVTLPDRSLDAEVDSVAAVAEPAGWWTGNVVKYDTIIRLPSVSGLKPGMSAEVELVLEEHKDVLTVPVAAVIETEASLLCWVKSPAGVKRRELKVGDSNDTYIMVTEGLLPGEEVVLHPASSVLEAQRVMLEQTGGQRSFVASTARGEHEAAPKAAAGGEHRD